MQTIAGGELDVDWPRIPARPAGMWRRRYAALVREAERAAERFDELPVRGA